MSWIYGLIIGLLVSNLLAVFLVFYYVNRNWNKLIEQTNFLSSIDRLNWNNTAKLAELASELKKQQ
ncbi:hypothetical protein OEV82_09155 [Caldibacillus thermolactis]|jgi:hypothetical protein|uniref:Uncharacterized protein n=1 Tax=Pallidibacillus thermolactis TaxID=251051 RepID=A0ABT2WG07_9BACI|nr:hypothetical protein [Pallidibacillus thermolactis]MCU9594623.1 hypothetical protein [Pallidibacillus thermolactis]